MSRGPGVLQRSVMKRLEAAPERRLSRRALEEIFVDEDRYHSSNLLRAVRGLVRMRLISLHEGPNLDQSYVYLLPPAEPVSDELVAKLLTELKGDHS
jgi:hypothetical protein